MGYCRVFLDFYGDKGRVEIGGWVGSYRLLLVFSLVGYGVGVRFRRGFGGRLFRLLMGGMWGDWG